MFHVDVRTFQCREMKSQLHPEDSFSLAARARQLLKPESEMNISKLSTEHPNLTTPHTPTPTSPRSSAAAIMLGSLSSMQPRQLAAQVLNFALVLSTAFMLWKVSPPIHQTSHLSFSSLTNNLLEFQGLSVFTNSSSPIVVVLSGSMEPAFQRGDLLFLWNRGMETQVGEVVVYNVRGKDIPIVHRVVRRFGGG